MAGEFAVDRRPGNSHPRFRFPWRAFRLGCALARTSHVLFFRLEARQARSPVCEGRAQAAGLDENLSIVPASLAKGLELDDVIVVEPSAIVADDAQGLRLLYVTLTRSTRSLTIVHRMPLPDAML